MSVVHPLLRRLVSLRERLERVLGAAPADDAEVPGWLRDAERARLAGRPDEAITLYRRVVLRQRTHVEALRGLRDLALVAGRWRDAIDSQQRVLAVLAPAERGAETETLAAIHYQYGQTELGRGAVEAAVLQFRNATRVDRRFLPAMLALGDAQRRAGDAREAVRTWERAVQSEPSLSLLSRLERAYREEGRPTRMIALYRNALERAPDDLALAVALGRVYLELEMLDEAADQFEKVEVRAPELAVVHAYLGEVFERRGDTRAAFDEYRRALDLGHVLDWPHRCRSCAATSPTWHDRCPQCGRWNTVEPVSGPRR